MNISNKVRFAFYLAKWGDTDIIDNVISWWTGLFNKGTIPTSHVEIGFNIDGEWKYYSSSMRKHLENGYKVNGTRWMEEKDLLKYPDRWYIIEVDALQDRTTIDMIYTLDSTVLKRYDLLGLLGFITLFGKINAKEKWYCSEVCYYIFTGIWKKRISPRRLYNFVINLSSIKLIN